MSQPKDRQTGQIAAPGIDLTAAETLPSAIAPDPAAATGALDPLLIERQNQQILELQRLVGSLGERLSAVQAASVREEQFRAAVRSVETAATAIQRGLSAPAVETPGKPVAPCGCDNKCAPCQCVSPQCCTFEVWMSHVRVDQMQNPVDPADTNAGVMEIWMFASIDPVHNIGACIPDPSPLSFLALHKQITDPFGPWVQVNRLVGSVTVKQGSPLTVPLTLTAVEREDETDRLIPRNRDEWGSGTETLTLDCCYANYSPIQISVPLTSWGQAGGAITGRFIVCKKC
ncbi:MAG: hypothetical protein JST93_32955 [Acidobacteria bacterium]|nr:hypothetical protein [Acidobacteriota bacterium]